MRAVDAGTSGEITLTADVTADCPYDHIVDEYVVTVEYRPGEHVVELQSYADHLAGYADREISHERLTETLFQRLRAELDPAALAVTVRGEHYGVDVEVRRSL